MWGNRIKTVILLALLNGIFLIIGSFFGGSVGITYAFIAALIMNGIAYFFSDRIVLRLYKAQTLDKEEYGWIYDIVQELSTTMHIPMPKLWLIRTSMANAFATGRNPQNASIAVTTGIIDILNQNELRGVLAHELAHVKNRDILISTIAATTATAIGYLANIMQHMAIWGSQDSRRQRANPLATLIIALFLPFAALLIRLAISRSREYLADETGAHVCHDPLALASALEKLHQQIKTDHLEHNDTAKASTAHLCIVHPFITQGLMNLFATHPPMHKRIARLKLLYEKQFRW